MSTAFCSNCRIVGGQVAVEPMRFQPHLCRTLCTLDLLSPAPPPSSGTMNASIGGRLLPRLARDSGLQTPRLPRAADCPYGAAQSVVHSCSKRCFHQREMVGADVCSNVISGWSDHLPKPGSDARGTHHCGTFARACVSVHSEAFAIWANPQAPSQERADTANRFEQSGIFNKRYGGAGLLGFRH